MAYINGNKVLFSSEFNINNATLITKEVTENKIYNASDDGADGYSSISVNVSNSGSNISQLVDKTIKSVSVDDLGEIDKIGAYAFHDCTRLSAIEIPSSVTRICEAAFRNCTSLSEITMSPNITVIENYAFYSCTSLSEITIPSNVVGIGDYAFGGDFYGNIKILAITPPTLYSYKVFSSNIQVMYIPAGTLSTYQSADYWSEHSSKFVELDA